MHKSTVDLKGFSVPKMNTLHPEYTKYDDEGYLEVYDMQNLFNQVIRQYNDMKQQVEDARQQVREFNKDEEIQKWKQIAEFNRSHALHLMNDKELEADRAFRNEHYTRHHPIPTKAGGNSYLYRLSGTGIGTIIEITCPECGETKDITDTESW